MTTSNDSVDEDPSALTPPYSFAFKVDVADIRQRYDDLVVGERSGEFLGTAGRLMLIRKQGKLVFAMLRDGTGQIQLMASATVSERFDEFLSLSIGDWVGIRGEVISSRRGELSIEVQSWEVLAKALRGFGDKWRGISDPDTRYRQRYVDTWANPEVKEVLLSRSKVVSLTRRFLDDKGFVEVETPVLQAIPTGAFAKPFLTHHNALDMGLHLRISLELYLKRLVVAGFEKVYEIGRVFRNEGISPRHNPEFTMLELYQAYVDYTDIMELVEQLVCHLAKEITGACVVDYQGSELDFTPPWRRATLEELTSESVGEEVSMEMDAGRLEKLLSANHVHVKPGWGVGRKIVELFEKTTEERLWVPTFVLDYPKEVSPLARDHRSKVDRVERFEAFVAGRELANAFSELIDPVEQRLRFLEQMEERAAGDEEAMVYDEDYVRALEYGLPPTGGLGIGMDRLAMLLTNTTQIREVVPFPTMRPEQGFS